MFHFANSVCVFGICLCIGIFANASIDFGPQAKKSRDLVLSFELENPLKIFILAMMATIGNLMEIPWLTIPWLKYSACRMAHQSFNYLYGASRISDPYFLISYTFNGIVLRALWFKMLVVFLQDLTRYVSLKYNENELIHELDIK
ncbi:uncharacterized protein LOC111045609 [Nilaparvata lugens]|uniref:uncharacterized protein LOC111045609 n=1 Tax=Nilaparvata lugens TaxID=108931 RepID=UPI00193CD839|nr:uncharacterized protein LOC111045609 [Nilaparvata lugens]